LSERGRFQNVKKFYFENVQVKYFDIFKIKCFIEEMVKHLVSRNKPFQLSISKHPLHLKIVFIRRKRLEVDEII